MKKFFSISLLLGVLGIPGLRAQSLTVDWFTVDGGGGASSAGTLTITGTAGQPDAGTMSDGTLTVQGGFWPIITAAAPVTSGYKIFYSTQSTTPSQNFVGSVNFDGTHNQHVLETATWPRVSPDGKKMLYHPVTTSTANFARNDLAIYDFATSNSSTIFANGDYVVYYDWRPGGTSVIFDFGCAIYRIDTNGANYGFVLGGDCYDDAPSIRQQDGTFIFHNVNQGLVLANGDGSNRQHVANTSSGDYWPNWSPDGQWIVFGNLNGYFKIKPDGSGKTNLWSHLTGASHVTFNGSDGWGSACFSPDGQWVVAAFNLNGTNGIYALAADGSGATKTLLTTGNAIDQTYNFIGGTAPIVSLPSPLLTIVPSGANQATISWTPTTPGFVLQESASLAPDSWSNAASGAQNPTTVSTAAGTKFYRLIAQ